MARPRSAARALWLPLFDYYGWALRLVKRIREGMTVADAVASARAYAKDVRDIECAGEAARLVERGAERARRNCAVPVAVIRLWEGAASDFGSGREFTDRKLAFFLSGMYKTVSAAQVAEAVREAVAQAAKAVSGGLQLVGVAAASCSLHGGPMSQCHRSWRHLWPHKHLASMNDSAESTASQS